MRYNTDEKDTEELYRQNVASVGYDNTIETAYPQTALYEIIDKHFRGDLPEGKTEKKVAVIGYDGCRADILAEVQEENSAVSYLLKNGGSNNLTYSGGVNFLQKTLRQLQLHQVGAQYLQVYGPMFTV
jgi:hypothetical protein